MKTDKPTPRARTRTTPPPPAKLTFETGHGLIQEAERLYSEHKEGLMPDDTARTRAYMLQTAAGILRSIEHERRIDVLEKTLARLESERGQLEHTFTL
jgi:hypothetical protein